MPKITIELELDDALRLYAHLQSVREGLGLVLLSTLARAIVNVQSAINKAIQEAINNDERPRELADRSSGTVGE